MKHEEARAPFGGLTGLAWKHLLKLDAMKKKVRAPKAQSVSEAPMHVRWCHEHGRQIDLDYAAYEVFRCPACMQDEVAKAFKKGVAAGKKLERQRTRKPSKKGDSNAD